MYVVPRSGCHAVPPVENYWTVGIMRAIVLVIRANVVLANRFVGSQGSSAATLVLSLVMRRRPVHLPMPNLAPSLLPCRASVEESYSLRHALGISENARAGGINSVTWSTELIAFCRVTANQAFVKNVEKALADFVGSDKKAHVLPHMPEVRRKFVMDVAEVYRVSTQLVDEEPRRSVQLIRRPDSRIPAPTLSQASAPTPSRLGSLGDLRKPTPVLPGQSSAPTAGAWRSATSSPAPANVGMSPNNASSGSSVLSRGRPMSGHAASGSSTTPWTRSSVAAAVRTNAPAVSAGSRTTLTPVGPRNSSGGREDVPVSWDDD
ncbi:shuttle craft protein [Ceratobasidium sp. AG-Ba]|nr:shuttle craft protein [Ceratobasidium sp. AG-Ba]QRW02736.1 shuttle craft protein [Ceratobasidium sp. AG-Ba]